MRRTVLLVWASAIAMVMAAGCSAAPPAGAGVGSTAQRQLSPPVEHPRDVRAYGDRPCEVLTIKQLKGFGFDLPPDRTFTLPSGQKVCVDR